MHPKLRSAAAWCGIDRGWARFRAVDWRLRLVLATVILVLGATGAAYWFGVWQDPSTHWGAVFASWVGGVALFAVTGAVVAYVTLAQPEKEAFDARARILFRRQSGKHIDYIVKRIQDTLEHYSEQTDVHVVIRGYDEESKKFRIAVGHKVTLRSYVDDITSTYSSSIEYDDVAGPPPGGSQIACFS
jgi:hypothetical protein